MELLWRLNELMHAKCLAHCFCAHRKHSIYASYFDDDNDDHYHTNAPDFLKEEWVNWILLSTIVFMLKTFFIEHFKQT